MREYSVVGQNVTVIAGATLVLINPPATRVIEIVRAWAGVEGVSSAQATTGIQLSLKASVFGTYVSTTPQKLKGSDPASGIAGGAAGAAATAGINASAEGAGAVTLLYPDTTNLQIPWLWDPSIQGGNTYIVSGADSLAFQMKLRGTPSVLTGWNFGVTYREIG
jgi:hypothetical protein